LPVCIAAGGKKFISLEFVSMVTECSYDYVFIYDGASYNSPLLGTFSGSTLPTTLVAKSGSVSDFAFLPPEL
jgi:multipile epidermal growth factor-like domains protein 8